MRWVISGILGLSCIFFLHEDDLLYQLRAGREFFQSWTLPVQDSWSFTIYGSPWLNYHFLSCILFYGVYYFFDYVGLSFFRGLLIAIWFGILSFFYQDKKNSYLFFIGLTFLAIFERLHLRPEAFIFIIFSLQFLTQRLVLQWILIILSGWLHAGLSPLIFVNAIFLLKKEKKISIQSLFLMGSGLFLTPYHVKMIPLWVWHAKYPNVMENSEWKGINVDLFLHHGVTYYLTYGLLLYALVFLIQRKNWLESIYFLVFFILSLKAIRFLPYGIVVAHYLVFRQVQIKKVFLGIPIGLFLVHFYKVIPVFHPGLSPLETPVDLVNFIKKNNLKITRLFSDMRISSDIGWFLPEIKIFIDHRDWPFDQVRDDFLAAFKSPMKMQSLLDQYKIDYVFLPIHQSTRHVNGSWQEPFQQYFPIQAWAFIFQSGDKGLYTRRSAWDPNQLKSLEYSIIHPARPFSIYRKNEKILSELERCLNEAPLGPYCRYIDAFLKKDKNYFYSIYPWRHRYSEPELDFLRQYLR